MLSNGVCFTCIFSLELYSDLTQITSKDVSSVSGAVILFFMFSC